MNATAQRTLENALTVGELIEELKMVDPAARVVFACDYGDICHTQQALTVETIDELAEDEALKESGYSKSGIAIESREIDWYCEACDEDFTIPDCPQCGTECRNEEGETLKQMEAKQEGHEAVVVLR